MANKSLEVLQVTNHAGDFGTNRLLDANPKPKAPSCNFIRRWPERFAKPPFWRNVHLRGKRRWNSKRQIIDIVQFTKLVNRWRYLNLVVHNLKATICPSNDVYGYKFQN